MILSGRDIKLSVNLLYSLLVGLFYLFIHDDGYYNFELRLIAAIGLIPVISMVLIFLKTKEIYISVVVLVLYQTWNMFLQPYVWNLPIRSIYRIFDEMDFPLMAFFCLISIWSLYFGFIYGIKHIKIRPIFKENILNTRQLEKILFLFIVCGYIIELLQSVIKYLKIPFSFLGAIEMMLPSTIAALALLYLIRGGRRFVYIFLVIVYILYYFIYYVGGTLFIYSIYLIIAPTIIYIVEKKKIPYKTLLFVVVLLLPIYMTRHNYRNEGLYSSGIDRFMIGCDIIRNEYGNFNISKWIDLKNAEAEEYNVDNRMEGVSYLATIIHNIDVGNSQYLYGKTLAWLPTMIIPHFMIPFRPPQNMGTDWAVYYGLKDPEWQASINFPMLCEFFVNFGFLGMIILSFINGLLIIWFMSKYNFGKGDVNLLFFIFIVTKIIVIEVNITIAYGLILQILFLCWLYKHFMMR